MSDRHARILHLVRTTLGLSGQLESRDRVAEAAVFSDGPAVLHWLTDPASTEIYPSEVAMRQVRESSGRSRFEEVPVPGYSRNIAVDPGAGPYRPEVLAAAMGNDGIVRLVVRNGAPVELTAETVGKILHRIAIREPAMLRQALAGARQPITGSAQL